MHKRTYIVHMATREATKKDARPPDGRYEPKGIRLSPELWAAITQEADSLGMSVSEVLRRRLGRIFQVESDVRKSNPARVEMQPAITLKEVPDDDD